MASARLRGALDGEPRLAATSSPGEWASVAPEALRVYDLSELVAVAPDMPAAAVELDGDPDGHGDGAVRLESARAGRFARELRAAVPTAAVYAHSRDVVLVLGGEAGWTPIEAAIARLARVGSVIARVEIDVLRDLGALGRALGVDAADGPWRKAAPVPGTTPPGGDGSIVALRDGAAPFTPTAGRLRVGVPAGSRFGSKRTTTLTYLRDVDVGTGNGGMLAAPLIGTLETGVVANVASRAGDRDGPGSLTIELAWSELVEPLATFSTTSPGVSRRLTIELPEVRAVRTTIEIPAVAGAAAYVGWAPVAFLLRVASVEASPPASGALVRRVVPLERDAASAASAARIGPSALVHVDAMRTPGSPTGPGSAAPGGLSVDLVTDYGYFAHASVQGPTVPTRTVSGASAPDARLASLPASPPPGVEVGVAPLRPAGGRSVIVSSIGVVDVDRPSRTFDGGSVMGTRLDLLLPRWHTVLEASADALASGSASSRVVQGPGGAGDLVRVDLRYGPDPMGVPAK